MNTLLLEKILKEEECKEWNIINNNDTYSYAICKSINHKTYLVIVSHIKYYYEVCDINFDYNKHHYYFWSDSLIETDEIRRDNPNKKIKFIQITNCDQPLSACILVGV